MTRRLIVIGGVAAGMSAAAKAKRVDSNLEIIVYERGEYISYAACGIPYVLAGDVSSHQKLIVRTPEQMAKQGIAVHLRHEVVDINAADRKVTIRNQGTKSEFSATYDRLVIATGARPALPLLPGTELSGVFGIRTLDSSLAIAGYLLEQKPTRAVVLGGGYIGVEMAETFRRLGLDVTMVIRSGKVMRATLDDDVRELVEKELERNGVRLVHSSIAGFDGQERLEAVRTLDGRIPCEVALLGLGARPNVELAEHAGVVLGTTGAIATDKYMRTNVPDVYAAGDCAEAHHLVTGKPAYIPLGSTANKQGRVAGTNAAGGSATFAGVVGTTVVRVFDLAVATTGLTADNARAAGHSVGETMIRASDISHFFPGAANIHVKLVVDRESDKLLGGQIVGKRGVAKRVDVLATALANRMTIGDLQRLDLSYSPPFAPVWDPILVAANVAAR